KSRRSDQYFQYLAVSGPLLAALSRFYFGLILAGISPGFDDRRSAITARVRVRNRGGGRPALESRQRLADRIDRVGVEQVRVLVRDLKAGVAEQLLDAARRESQGEIVVRKPGGSPCNHVQELRDAQTGLLNRIQSINRELSYPGLSDAQRTVLQRELSEA